jgi:polyketide synthase PksN
MARGVKSLFYLAKSIQSINLDKSLEIVLISNYVNEVSGNEKIIKPENAALFGLAMVVDSENLKARIVQQEVAAPREKECEARRGNAARGHRIEG